jgi:hypothetical protein
MVRREPRLSRDSIDYQRLVEDALRDAVRRLLAEVAELGLPGEHSFYLGFRTRHPGVLMPRSLRDLYPEEMTIILQHQFWNLEVGADAFSLKLSSTEKASAPVHSVRRADDVCGSLGGVCPALHAAAAGRGRSEGQRTADAGRGRGGGLAGIRCRRPPPRAGRGHPLRSVAPQVK